MERNTQITNALEASRSGLQVQYDQNVKNLLADRQIFARIIKYSLTEFEDIPIQDVIENIGNVTSKPLEAQKTDNPEKLKYHIENRGVFYIGRMISSQKEVKFRNINYDGLRKVKSIWICMNSAEDSIIRYTFKPNIVYGTFTGEIISGQMEMLLIRIRNDRDAEKSKNVLIAMLEDLLRNDSIEEKKKNLSEYDIEITETIEGSVNAMCNLSDIILEKGIEEGMEEGKTQGIVYNIVSLTCRKLKKNKTPETIADELEEDYDKIKSICDIADAFAPDYDVDAICAQLQNAK